MQKIRMQRIDWKYRIAFVLFWFVMLLMLSNLTSCTTAKKFLRSPAFAKACAEKFPARDTIIENIFHYETDTVFLSGDTLVYIDTIVVPGGFRIDTIVKRCPPSRTITNTVIQEKQIIRIDSAKITAICKDLEFTKSEVDKWAGKAKRRGKSFMWSIIGNVLLLLTMGWLIGKKPKF
jgi:hypothetical protein